MIPRLVFDGDCRFCKRCVLWLQARTGSRVEFVPYQDCDDSHLDPDECAKAVHLIDRGGIVSRGAEAIIRAYAHAPGRAWFGAMTKLPGFTALFEPLYRQVAKHRVGISALVSLGSGKDPEPSTWLFARRGFIVLLGFALFAAFLSLRGQVDGLFGPRGLIPITEYSDWSAPSIKGIRETPSLLWLMPTVEAVHGICLLGMIAAGLLILGVWPRLMILIGFVGYVSVMNVGEELLDWPWDRLLCEATFLAWFVVPRGRLPRWREHPSAAGVWLLRLFLVRILLVSGLFKLFGSDPAWQSFSAFEYQLWTQPLPSWPGYLIYYAGSAGLAKVAAILMVCIEVGAPLAMLGPRRLRILAVLAILVLQLALGVSGNESFQPLILVALALFAVDDQTLRAWLPRRIGLWLPRAERAAFDLPGSFLRLSALVLLVSAAGILTLERVRGRALTRGVVADSLLFAERAHLVHAQVLHASVRRRRPELVIECSRNGLEWRELQFRFKPGNPEDQRRPDRLPPWVGLHAPRLDLQMHRAAFLAETSAGLEDRWMIGLVRGVLLGVPAVYELLGDTEFAHEPPQYLRVKLYRYRFDLQRSRRGGFWRREFRGLVVPPIKLDGGEVVRAW